MAYEQYNRNGKKHTLYKKEVTLKSGYVSTIYFFVPEGNGTTVGSEPCDLPTDREAIQTRSGMLVLRKKA